MHTVPESPETIRLTCRPVLGGTDRERVVAREERVTVGSRRVDPGSVPLLESDLLEDVPLRDGDRVSVLRAVDPGAEEETYVRRWGVWRPTTGGDDRSAVSDAQVRDWARTAEDVGVVVRHLPRPAAEPAGPAVPRGRRVVVTGLGAVTPLGVGVGELWRGLLEGRHGIRELTGPEFEELPVRVAGTVPVDPASLLDRTAARRMNRAAQFAVLAAREAWGDAGFEAGGTEAAGLDPARVGVSLGAILGDASVLVGGDRRLRERGPRGVSPLTTPMTVPSQAASQVSLDLHITGEARTVTAACASGTEAIGEAIDRIRYGRVDVALAGGRRGGRHPGDHGLVRGDAGTVAARRGRGTVAVAAVRRGPGRFRQRRGRRRARAGGRGARACARGADLLRGRRAGGCPPTPTTWPRPTPPAAASHGRCGRPYRTRVGIPWTSSTSTRTPPPPPRATSPRPPHCGACSGSGRCR
ncbi:hypothetical protein GCM10020256_23190 [Streptomyces thermocoprophilus]